MRRVETASFSRRRIAALLAGGLFAPIAARAAPMASQLGQFNAPVVVGTELKPALLPDQTSRLGADLYHRVTVPVTINGAGPYAFVVDTGANQSVICTEIALALGLPMGSQMSLHGVAGVETTSTALVQEVVVGGRHEPNVLMPVQPRAAIGADGLLGIDRLQNRRVRLDFRAGQLTVEGSGFDAPQAHATRVSARHRAGQLTIVDAAVSGIAVSAFLDSGAERSIGNPALRDLATLRLSDLTLQKVPIIGVTGASVPGELAVLPELRMGDMRLRNIRVTFADLQLFRMWGLNKPAILVGMDAMSVFDAVTLDFGRAEVLFELYPGRRDQAG